MNKSLWSFLTAMVTLGLTAQTETNAPLSTPPSTTAPAPGSSTSGTTPAAKPAHAKKTVAKKKPAKPANEASLLRSVALQPGLAVVVVSNLNVRGQAKLNSEVVAHLTKGEVVTVIEEITLKHSAPDEPSAWAKILLPSGARVWINGNYLDADKKTVAARKLNLRGGPGENYSVLGLLLRGETFTQVKTKDEWLQIEAPTNAYGYVAAQYLQQRPPEAPAAPTVVATPPPVVAATPETTPTPPPVAEPQKEVVPPPQTATAAAPIVAEPPPAAATVATPPPTAPAVTAEEPATAAVEQPLPPRVVQREGIVRGTSSIQAPTHFELVSTENGKTINYLHTPSPYLDLRRWKGLHILVTGEEGLDERWQNTPILTIQKLELLDEK
jgi:uncharacterized protein YraI